MQEFRTIVSRLLFPEGPIALPDGSILLVEIQGQRLTKIKPDGVRTTVAKTGGGPNGAAVGPDGKVYICNNGGYVYHHFAVCSTALALPRKISIHARWQNTLAWVGTRAASRARVTASSANA